jgi:hypothetical protein
MSEWVSKRLPAACQVRHMLCLPPQRSYGVLVLLVALAFSACGTRPALSGVPTPAPSPSLQGVAPQATTTPAAPHTTNTPAAPTAQPATIPLHIGDHTLQVELATTSEQRSRGLMFREDLPSNGGMLFVYDWEGYRSFWMKNTPLPLSAAFLDAERRILNIAQMEPFDETSHRSAEPAQYVLEVHQGWFAERGIGPGDVATFQVPPDVEIE